MKIAGHRGAMALAAENTLESIELGIKSGADYVEFDIHTTSDLIPVLSHEPIITVKEKGKGKEYEIAKGTFSDLQFMHPTLTTLETVLPLFAKQPQPANCRPLIEIKPDVPVKPIVDVLQKFISSGFKAEDILLSSFSQRALRELHKALPEIPLMVIEPWSGVRANFRARQVGAHKVAMNQQWLWSGFIKAASRNVELFAYTVNDPAKAKRWEKYGLAGIVTDDPAQMKKALQEKS